MRDGLTSSSVVFDIAVDLVVGVVAKCDSPLTLDVGDPVVGRGYGDVCSQIESLRSGYGMDEGQEGQVRE